MHEPLRKEFSMSVTPSPFVMITTAMSLDGCIDERTETRLILSSAADQAAVDQLRSSFDAILIGAQTLRRDNPRLLLREPQLQQERSAKGMTPHPRKVVLTRSTNLDPAARFFTEGDVEKLVYCPASVQSELQKKLGAKATVVGLPSNPEPAPVLEDLAKRGVQRLMVEGGGTINGLFMRARVVDELRIAVGPFFVGDAGAPRVVDGGALPHNKDHRMVLSGVSALGDMAVLQYKARR